MDCCILLMTRGLESRYFALSTEFNEQFENRKGSIDPDVYAKEVVNFIEKKTETNVGQGILVQWSGGWKR